MFLTRVCWRGSVLQFELWPFQTNGEILYPAARSQLLHSEASFKATWHSVSRATQGEKQNSNLNDTRIDDEDISRYHFTTQLEGTQTINSLLGTEMLIPSLLVLLL